MRQVHRCPTCQTELESQLVPHGTGGGDFTQVWRCPNAANHGIPVECANDCGEMVPNVRYHYSYTPGLLGSGRWSCFPRRRCTAWIKGSADFCNELLPCKAHPLEEFAWPR